MGSVSNQGKMRLASAHFGNMFRNAGFMTQYVQKCSCSLAVGTMQSQYLEDDAVRVVCKEGDSSRTVWIPCVQPRRKAIDACPSKRVQHVGFTIQYVQYYSNVQYVQHLVIWLWPQWKAETWLHGGRVWMDDTRVCNLLSAITLDFLHMAASYSNTTGGDRRST
jgi:hypothetical protein